MSKKQLGDKKQWTAEEWFAETRRIGGLDNLINNVFIGMMKTHYSIPHAGGRSEDEMQENLKYDPKENTQELALNYKEDGNFYMKHKMFRSAVESFTEGIEAKCKNPEVQAVLYNNRSAAHYYLMNYRLALGDAQQALVYKPDYAKTRWRAARCAAELNKFELCTRLCEELLEQDSSHKEAQELIKHNKAKKLEIERNARREVAAAKKQLAQFRSLCNSLKSRGVKFYGLEENKPITAELLRPKIFDPGYSVHLANDCETLIWPTAFFYPELLRTDLIHQLCENVIMEHILADLLSRLSQRDEIHKYRSDNVTVYYENPNAVCMHKVDLQKTIKDIISEEGFFVNGGCLPFYVLLTGSRQEQEFINQHGMRR